MEVSDSAAYLPPLGSQFRGCDLLPEVKSVLHFLTIGRRGESMTTWAEVLKDEATGREKALGVAG
jgi:hypothetical protein